MMSIGVKKAVAGVVIALVVFVLGIPILFWLAVRAVDRALGWPHIMGDGPAFILAAVSALAGVFWVTWSWSYLIFVGRGLPIEAFGKALHPTRVLVTAGPYAYTRNPMVLGYLMILLGVAFLGRSISGVVAIPILAAGTYGYLVTFEEKALVARFGQDYERYRRSVPSLFPRLSAYVHGATES
jgi:protein-S-isoprenylcysteine O-methyltransferase Ste14